MYIPAYNYCAIRGSIRHLHLTRVFFEYRLIIILWEKMNCFLEKFIFINAIFWGSSIPTLSKTK